jgi:hypothetical protein
MKLLSSVCLIVGLFFCLSSTLPENSLHQVITSDPHELEMLAPYMDTVYQNGRLWVVQLSQSTPRELMKFVKPLTGGEKSYELDRKVLSNKKGGKKDEIRPLVQNIDREFIKNDVKKLSGFRSRYAGTKDNQLAVEQMSERFKELGYLTRNICYSKDACSVVADKSGGENSGKVILIMAHIDSVGEAFAGADDNATGVAVLMEMARVLKDLKFKNNIRFFISNGEERGLLGASHYVRTLATQSKLQEIHFVINLDMVGYNSNGVVELETNPEFENEAIWYADLAVRYTKLKTKIALGAWGSDHVVFLRRGIPSVMVIENWDTKNPCYHQPCDAPDRINYDYAAEIARMNIAAVISKDEDL